MKTAILLLNDATQIVLTPETELERRALQFIRQDGSVQVLSGSFYIGPCIGGWQRQYQDDQSVILLLEKRTEETDIP